MGICEILTIVFVVLKLVGIITWSWWLVLLPVIIEVAFTLIVFIICIITTHQITNPFKKNHWWRK